VDDLSFAFPGLKIEEDVVEEEDMEICIFLFSDKIEIYNIYLIARLYLDENFGLDSAIVLRLLDKKNIDIEEGLRDIFYIHSGYVGVIIQDMKDGGESDKD
jgi:hypothetical protein